MATATLGFGLFNIEFKIGPSLTEPTPEAAFLLWRLGFGAAALASYAFAFRSTALLLIKYPTISGEQIARGPLLYTALEIGYTLIAFITTAFDIPAPLQNPYWRL